MPVSLYTGLPGAGKTAGLVARILELREKEPGRPVFQMGINGLVPGFANDLTMEQLENWRTELPPGSIICLDECQEEHLMPQDKGAPKGWVKDISKVRHEGMDFILTTQHPTLMSSFVRRLVDRHTHFVRKWNTNVQQRYTWNRCMDKPESPNQQKQATEEFGTLPKEVFELYKSSNAHNMKRKIPRKFWWFVFLVVAAAVMIPYAVYTVLHLGGKTSAVAAKVGDSTGKFSSAEKGSSEDDDLRRKDYKAWMRPRVDGVPWTAPAFDGLQVKSEPRLFCIAVDDGRCTCQTEQGTKYEVKPDMCRAVAAGGMYNPFQAPREDGRSGERRESRRDDRPQAVSAGMDAAIMGDNGSAERKGVHVTYAPPGTLPWNSDPFGGGKGSAR